MALVHSRIVVALCVSLLGLICHADIAQAVATGEIYSLDNYLDDKLVSLEARAGDDLVTTSGRNIALPGQRFIARANNDNTFTLFLEDQPWNWVEHIVESNQQVNIKVTPRVLEARIVDGVKEVVQAAYKGTSSNPQKWYIVPSNENDPDEGAITNLLHRECIVNNGVGNPATLEICNRSDPRQVFRFANRTVGRCY